MSLVVGACLCLLMAHVAFATGSSGAEGSGRRIGSVLLDLLVLLVAAKLAAEVAERLRQPAVLGELVAGVVLGPSVLGLVGRTEAIAILAELGVILLLFVVGLETNLVDILRVGPRSFVVASIGVFFPFLLGGLAVYALGVGADRQMTAIFMGAAMTATSVGITTRVFADLKRLHTDEAKVVLGAAAIDDVIGLVILAVVVSLIQHGRVTPVSVAKPILYAVVFLFLAVAVGSRVAPLVFDFIDRHLRVQGVRVTIAFVFALILAYIADAIGLASIVGAFAAGLILARTRQREELQREITPLAHVFVPIFFLLVGIMINVRSCGSAAVLELAAVVTALAIIGKLLCGLGLVRSAVNWLTVGVAMIPRGEVGLIFASVGLSYGVINDKGYSALLVMVVVTTFLAPPLLKVALSRVRPIRLQEQEVEEELARLVEESGLS